MEGQGGEVTRKSARDAPHKAGAKGVKRSEGEAQRHMNGTTRVRFLNLFRSSLCSDMSSRLVGAPSSIPGPGEMAQTGPSASEPFRPAGEDGSRRDAHRPHKRAKAAPSCVFACSKCKLVSHICAIVLSIA